MSDVFEEMFGSSFEEITDLSNWTETTGTGQVMDCPECGARNQFVVNDATPSQGYCMTERKTYVLGPGPVMKIRAEALARGEGIGYEEAFRRHEIIREAAYDLLCAVRRLINITGHTDACAELRGLGNTECTKACTQARAAIAKATGAPPRDAFALSQYPAPPDALEALKRSGLWKEGDPVPVMTGHPPPDQHPDCQCKGDPMRAMFCMSGHMLECHYPLSCSQAKCSHLSKYDPEDAA